MVSTIFFHPLKGTRITTHVDRVRNVVLGCYHGILLLVQEAEGQENEKSNDEYQWEIVKILGKAIAFYRKIKYKFAT
jgi:hypothetical protein